MEIIYFYLLMIILMLLVLIISIGHLNKNIIKLHNNLDSKLSSIDRANEYNIRKQNHLIGVINECKTKVSFDKIKCNMEYYVARDANGSLYMYTDIPKRKDGYWEVTNGNFYTISPRLFDVKWSDEPIKITIEIWNKK